MNIVLFIVAAICLLVGIVGCIVPALPSVPLAYLSLLLLHFTDQVQYSWQFLVIWGAIIATVQVLDFVIPAWGTKKFGGTKWGVWGSTIGLFIGLVLGPIGIVLGPFVGAVIGEMLYFKRHPEVSEPTKTEGESVPDAASKPSGNTRFNRALRAGFGSFIGLLTGTLLKLICCGFVVYYYVAALL